MLSPVPAATTAPPHLPATSIGPRTRGTTVVQSRSPSTTPAGRTGTRPSPATSTRCPTRRRGRSPARPSAGIVSQSCGSTTWARRSQASGSLRCSHDSLVIVNEATGTLPTAAAHAAPPPSSWPDQPAGVGGALGVVPQLGRPDDPPVGVEHDHAVLLAGDADRGDRRCAGARPGVLERRPPRGGILLADAAAWSADGAPTTGDDAPESRSRTSTLVLWVDESTPAINDITAMLRFGRSTHGTTRRVKIGRRLVAVLVPLTGRRYASGTLETGQPRPFETGGEPTTCRNHAYVASVPCSSVSRSSQQRAATTTRNRASTEPDVTEPAGDTTPATEPPADTTHRPPPKRRRTPRPRAPHRRRRRWRTGRDARHHSQGRRRQRLDRRRQRLLGRQGQRRADRLQLRRRDLRRGHRDRPRR